MAVTRRLDGSTAIDVAVIAGQELNAQRMAALTQAADEGLERLRTDRQAGGPIGAKRLVMPDNNGALVQAGVNDSVIVGINDEGEDVGTNDAMFLGIAGKFEGVADGPIKSGRLVKSGNGGRIVQMLTGENAIQDMVATVTGHAFANQPANDSVTLVSTEANDLMNVIVYGTTNGGTVLAKEIIALDGVTPVTTVKSDWGLILGVQVMGPHAGDITVSETSGSQAIVLITAGTQRAGIADVPQNKQYAYNGIPRVLADGATTKVVGFVGVNGTYGELLTATALTGATPKDFGNTAANQVHILLVGDVENTRTVTLRTGVADSTNLKVGKAIGSATAEGQAVNFVLSL